MPEAIRSTTMSPKEDQPSTIDLEVFDGTICELEALTYLLCTSLNQGGGLHENIIYGINELFRGIAYDFREIYDELKQDRVRGPAPAPAAFHNASAAEIRDQFIQKSHREGLSSSVISMVLNLRRSAVLRALDRINGPTGQTAAT